MVTIRFTRIQNPAYRYVWLSPLPPIIVVYTRTPFDPHRPLAFLPEAAELLLLE